MVKNAVFISENGFCQDAHCLSTTDGTFGTYFDRFYSGRYRFISNFFSKLSFYVVLDCYKTVFRLNLVNDEFKLCCVTISCIYQFPYLFTNYAAICLAIYMSVYLYAGA